MFEVNAINCSVIQGEAIHLHLYFLKEGNLNVPQNKATVCFFFQFNLEIGKSCFP